MTDIGESVAITNIKLDDDPEYHFAELQICFPNGKPFFADENINVTAVIDGDQRAAQTNFESSVNQTLLEPGTQVEFKIEENIDNEIAETRNKIQGALDLIIQKERDEQAILDRTLDESGWLGRKAILLGAFMTGVGEGALGLVEFIGDTAELVYDAAWYKHQVLVANNLEAAWDTLYKKGDVEAFYDSVGEKNVEDFATAFGTTPNQLAHKIADTYQIFNFVMDDGETQKMLLQFAQDYATSQAKVELAKIGGSAVFDIILTAILAVTTGGAGNVAQAGAKIRHFDYFKKLAEHLQKLTRQLKRKSAQKTVAGKLDSKIQHKVELPNPQKVEPQKSQAKSKQDKNENSQPSADDEHNNSAKNTESSSAAGSTSPKESTAAGKNKQGQTCSADSQTCVSGEPISLVTGEEMLTVDEFTIPGPLPLKWQRTYKSSNPDNVGLGYGWTHTFAEHLEIADNQANFHTNEARIITFNLPAVGAKSLNTAEKLEIRRSGENQFILTSIEPGQTLVKHFESIGHTSKFLLCKISDAHNNYIQLHYQDNQLNEVRTPFGDLWKFGYNEQQTLSRIDKVNAEGDLKTLAKFEYDEFNDLHVAFDANGNAERYSYKNHLLQQRTLKSGYSFYFVWDSDDHHARCLEQYGDPIDGVATYHYKFKWDTAKRIVAATDTRGGTQIYQFNDRGLPIYHRDAEGGETVTRYDDLGNIVSIKTPNGHYKNLTYDEKQRLIIHSDALGNKHELKRNAQGYVTDIYDPLGHRWTRRFDKKGNLCQQINPLGDTLSFAYNGMGLISSVTNAEGTSWHYIWDHKGQLTAIRDPQGRHTRYTYNADHKLTQITYPDGLVSQYQYDHAGNCTFIKSPDGKTQHFEYNALGLVTKQTDQSGRVTEYSYNGLSQVVRKVDSTGHVLRYHYDGERNLIGLTNQNGESYQLTYDLNERLIQEVGFDGRIQQYHYDAEGFLTGKADISHDRKQSLNEIVFKRDPIGRLLEQAELSDKGLTPLSNYRYDALGRLVHAQNKHRTLKWKYDAIGRVLEDHQDQHVTKHHYAKAGPKISTMLPDGQELSYQYNETGAFSGLLANGKLITQIEHNDFGRETRRQHGNQLATEFRYDPQGRLKAQRTGTPSNDNGFRPINQRRITYNDKGLINQIDDQLRGRTRYHYDALDRLTQVDGPNPEKFVHDPAGNILATQTPDSQPDTGKVQGNRLNFHGDQHFQYDDLGNRIEARRGKQQKQLTRYNYDALNQLSSIELNRITTNYCYDPLGRRIRKVQGERSVEFLWQADTPLSEKTFENGEMKSDRVYLFEPNTFKPIAFLEGDKAYHYHLDHLGTPQEITDNAGKLVWAVNYRAYGNLAVAYKNEITNPIRFQGQYYDEESGLHYNRFRYYDPECGRFINQDPIGLLGGLNNYLYVPNPTGWVDPFGLSCKEIPENYDPLTDTYTGVDINLFSPEEQIHFSAKNVANNHNTFIVGGHGSHSSIINAAEERLSSQELAKLIKESPKYEPGMQVNLYSCNTGNFNANPNCYAQQLATELGSDVVAPDTLLWYWPDGRIAPYNDTPDGEIDYNQPGQFYKFKPAK